MTTPRTQSWIDLKIPLWGIITLAVTILVQTASLLIWGAQIDARVTQHNEAITELQTKASANGKLAETVARMDERTQALALTVNRIDQRLDRKGYP